MRAQGKPTGKSWLDRVYDLRVEDSPAPLPELRRLVKLQTAYNLMNDGDLAVERKDDAGALKAYAAAEGLVGDNAEMAFWHAVVRQLWHEMIRRVAGRYGFPFRNWPIAENSAITTS